MLVAPYTRVSTAGKGQDLEKQVQVRHREAERAGDVVYKAVIHFLTHKKRLTGP